MKVREYIIYIIAWLIICLTSLILIAGIVRVFVCDRFIVRGVSMYPTLSDGEPVWINKLLMGARIYKSFDTESPELESFRMPGIRDLTVGDLAIFNNPYGRDKEKIEFRINYVYLKRCVGCPGDTVGIRNCLFYNTRTGDVGLDDEIQHGMEEVPDSLLSYPRGVFPFVSDLGWTMKSMGPLVIPSKGMNILLDSISTSIYAKVIEYETGRLPVWRYGRCYLGEESLSSYTVGENYYYFIGDNVPQSRDSRYFGFVPEAYVVGIIGGKSSIR